MLKQAFKECIDACFVVLNQITDMKFILHAFLYVLCLCTISSQVNAQKYAHVNLGNLLTKMPEVDEGSVKLEKYQELLIQELQTKAADWEKRYKDLESKVSTMAPNDVKAEEQKLLQEQQKLVEEERMIAVKVQEKRAEIMGPILQKVQAAIDAIGAENGFTMIFDTSIPNAILFVEESDDLTSQILAKLGIN